METRVINNWDRHYKNQYRVFLSRIGLKGNIVLNNNIAKYITKSCNRFNSFIEIGAGSGRLTKILSRSFDNIFVLDKSEPALELACKVVKKAIPIHADIFLFEKQSFDMVASVGLVEHFNKDDMHKLIEKHLSLANDNGCVLICVPSYSKWREIEVLQPNMVMKYGFQDPYAEDKISEYLVMKNIAFDKFYLDKISGNNKIKKFLRRLNSILFYLLRINLESLFNNQKGDYTVFFINKRLIKV